MTSKQDPVELDALSIILHSAQAGHTLEDYITRVQNMARKKVRRISTGLVEA